jgi:hypothetical protein
MSNRNNDRNEPNLYPHNVGENAGFRLARDRFEAAKERAKSAPTDESAKADLIKARETYKVIARGRGISVGKLS